MTYGKMWIRVHAKIQVVMDQNSQKFYWLKEEA